MYKLTTEQGYIQRLSDNAFIPVNPDNKDYQAYLKWLEESPDNIPQEAE